MLIADVVRSFLKYPEFSSPLQNVSECTLWQSLSAEGRPFLVASYYLSHLQKTFIITPSYERALQWQAKLTLCGVPESQIKQLPSGISALFEDAAPETNALSERLGSLYSLLDPKPSILITTPQAALERTLPKEILEQFQISLKNGQEISPEKILQFLVQTGYEPADPVRLPGQFCKRGGLLDIYSFGTNTPVRIEFFGDQIESLRDFDPNSQRSLQPISEITIIPARETIYPSEKTDIHQLLLQAVEQESSQLSTEASKHLKELIQNDKINLEAHSYFNRLDLYRPFIYSDSGCAIDLLKNGLVVLDEPMELESIATRSSEELKQALIARTERGEILKTPITDFLVPIEHIQLSPKLLCLSSINNLPRWLQPSKVQDWNLSSLDAYKGNPKALHHMLQTWTEKGFQLIIGTDQPSRAKAALAQAEVVIHETQNLTSHQTGLFLANGNLAGGWILPELKLALITDQELFGVGRLRLPQKKSHEGIPITTVLDLKEGDYVVHIHFGIGIFKGLVKRAVDGIEKEYLFIEYAAPDKLFVPADQLDRIQKYLNPADANPKISRLTGGEWHRTVAKAREEARVFARELIQLYAKRKGVERISCGEDSPWQAELEATFPWVETPSQLQAIQEVKKDLELPYPMDRLICGDVGFGKTEVAIRAAFKVAQAGKQVVVLCPTTILSEQHYRNFEERLASFPIRLEILNRFRPQSAHKKVIQELEKGEVQIVIGTHSLLNKNLKFHDLGLAIIDEEQKFGVKQKEALKALRTNADILTLSATPIPRTLSMALMDIRQMSLINDPPPGRLPVRTYVRPYSKNVVTEAMLRELSRGGQIYYVYNRVQGIYHIAEKLRRLIPNAIIGVAHGQMAESEIEPIMIGFIKGEIDILLSTTIVENGLDISNANTLIVEDADRFGLSQLYQLRGRVGRSDRQAYAYLLYPDSKDLTENAIARLKALQEFSTLGSGYSLAYRDLQIRGAGELLGAKQHGTMANVGYELFTQIIQQEVEVLKSVADGKEPAQTRDPLEGLELLPIIDLPITALIPESYIPDQGQRLYHYKMIMSCRSVQELTKTKEGLEDCYGKLPPPVKKAFAVMRLRVLAQKLKIDKIMASTGRLIIRFRKKNIVSDRLMSLLRKRNREAAFSADQLHWPYQNDPLIACEEVLESLRQSLLEIQMQRLALEE